MNEQPKSLLDHAFKLLDDIRSPQDFTLILHFRNRLDLESLAAGAKSAGEYFHTGREITIETAHDINGFVNRRFDANRNGPVRQMLNGTMLATRFHHAVADECRLLVGPSA